MSEAELTSYSSFQIRNKILTVRNKQVLLDSDLATFYGVETKVLNQAVKRNIERFPSGFMFELSKREKNELVTNCDHLQNLKFSPNLPKAFTEQGVAMLSGVLRSETAIKMSILIIEAFVEMRKFLVDNASLINKINSIEQKQIQNKLEADQNFAKIFNALQKMDTEPREGIFFDGEIFDAYKFVAGLVRKAKTTIILFDNYIDETVLDMFSKKKKDVVVKIYTKRITKTMQLDIKKFNEQYPLVKIFEFKDAHDRFLIVDEKEIYHIGASLKDLGKKWFAFSKLELDSVTILDKIKH